MKKIIVKTQFEGLHWYPNAPFEVAYLRHPHRHMFHVTAEISVFHNERDLEFMMVKKTMDSVLVKFSSMSLPNSCEDMAEEIMQYLEKKYQPEDWPVRSRFIAVTVSEDGENGAYVDNQK